MVYIFGVTLPSNQKVIYALPKLFGLNKASSLDICNKIGITEHCRISQLNDLHVSKICKIIEEGYIYESDLRKTIMFNIKRLCDIGSYRGYRHSYGLPVRGQRTHTNRKTQKSISIRYRIIKK